MVLKEKGRFKTNQSSGRVTWFSQADVSAFARRLLDLRPSSTFSAKEKQCLTLGSTFAWERISTDTKALLIERILEKGISVEGGINGQVSGSMRLQSWVVDHKSLESFRREYVSILSIAKMERTTSKKLIRLCWTNLISLVWPRTERQSGRQLLIRSRDVPALQYALRTCRDKQ
jgi:hypothetical protein